MGNRESKGDQRRREEQGVQLLVQGVRGDAELGERDSEESDEDAHELAEERLQEGGAERLFQIQPNDICLGLFGISCAGKSSLVKMILHRICGIPHTEPIICGPEIIRVCEGPVELRAPIVLLLTIPNMETSRRLLLVDFPGFSVHDVGAADHPRSPGAIQEASDTVKKLLRKFMKRIDYYIWVVISKNSVDKYTITPDVQEFVYPLKCPRLLDRLLVVSTHGDFWHSPEARGAQNWRRVLVNAINHHLTTKGFRERMREDQILITCTKGYSFQPDDWKIEQAAGPEWWQPLAERLRADLSDRSPLIDAIDTRQQKRNQRKARWIFWVGFSVVVGIPVLATAGGVALLTAGAALPLEALVVGAVVAPVGGVAAGAGAGAGLGFHQNMIDRLERRHPAIPIDIEP